MPQKLFSKGSCKTLLSAPLRHRARVTALITVTCLLTSGCSERSNTETVGEPDSKRSKTKTGQAPHEGKPDRRESPPSIDTFNLSADPDAKELLRAWNDLGKSELKGLALSAAQEKFIQQASRHVEISRLCELLASVKGPGSHRTRLIELAFAYSGNSSSSLLLAMASLPSASERASVGNALAMHPTIELSDFTLLGSMSEECEDLYVNKLSLTVSSSTTKDQTADACLKSLSLAISEGRAKTSSLSRFLRTMSIDSPFEAWGFATASTGSGLSSSEREAILGEIARNMSRHDPAEAMQRLHSSDGGHRFAGAAVSSWFDKDSDEVKNWYAENRQSMSPSFSDASSASIAAKLANQGDISSARRWMEFVEDPEARHRIEGQVWTAERNQLRNEVSADPDGTMNTILSGGSQYGDYWIEEAMATWISKEPAKAEEWYQANWNSLPPSRSQYIAAAYAKNALGLGDTATARQWTSLIEDSKTRERIITSIEKAVASQGQ